MLVVVMHAWIDILCSYMVKNISQIVINSIDITWRDSFLTCSGTYMSIVCIGMHAVLPA